MSYFCTDCPRKCGIDREIRVGFCGVGRGYRVARIAPHLFEEPCICQGKGSGAVFFSGCNLRCCFCQNYDLSHSAKGIDLSEEELMTAILDLQKEGVCNINLVTPTHYVTPLAHTLQNLKPKLTVPVVWNCGGYDKAEKLKTLEGLVDIYLPDMKYAFPETAKKYSKAENYPEVSFEALAEMLRQQPKLVFEGDTLKKGVIVRHLVLPGHRKESIALLERLKNTFGTENYLLSLMWQYTPDFAERCPYENLHRRVTTFEYRSVQDTAVALGFEGFSQEKSSSVKAYTPDFDKK